MLLVWLLIEFLSLGEVNFIVEDIFLVEYFKNGVK